MSSGMQDAPNYTFCNCEINYAQILQQALGVFFNFLVCQLIRIKVKFSSVIDKKLEVSRSLV